MKKFMKKLLKALPMILILLFLLFSYYISDQVGQGFSQMSQPEQTIQNSMDFLKTSGFDLDRFNQTYEKEDFVIPSTYADHQIPILAYKTKKEPKGAVILVHGLGGSKESTLPQGEIFLDMGYDIYAYDQRNSGNNTAKTNSFGVLESKDLRDLVKQLDKTLDENQSLIVWGVSLGGITVGIASDQIQDQVDYLILDSPMSDAEVIVRMELDNISQETGLPANYMYILGDWNLRLLHGYSLSEAKAVDHIQNCQTPLLVFHSKDDQVIPFEMGNAIYQASPADHKKLVQVDKSQHVMMVVEHPDLYRQSLEEFLNK